MAEDHEVQYRYRSEYAQQSPEHDLRPVSRTDEWPDVFFGITSFQRFTSYKANIGKLENKGFELKVTGYLLRDTERELIWSVTGSLVRNKDKIIKLSEAMKEANATLLATGGATPNKVWQEGDSQNAIYAVPSLGIDPINGRELFLKKSGEVTYTWDARDRVFCGVDQSDYPGKY